MKRLSVIAAAAALGVMATPVAAQMGFDGANFVQAVRERDGNKAMELLRSRPVVINARDDRGDTALLIAIARKDDNWTGFLLQEGADPNLAARNGDTPLIAAARAGYAQGVAWLLGLGAKVDGDNRMGETALIIAVQQRQLPIIRALLEAGANPDKTDSAAGFSARDYAKRDTRSSEILRMIETVRPSASAAAGR
ncbi:MAG TPA: ankyrin repeat domain-containing protein [Sphingomicrobium sp.]|nr:ankyrin repeat domain-containing protein [Sphingomicrobium sp.]